MKMPRTAPGLPLRAVLLGLALLLQVGCATPRQDGPVVGAAGQPTTLVVSNQSTSEIRVYAVASGGQRVRLGNVNGLATQNLRIPDSLVGVGGRDIVFQADPLAGRSVASSFSYYVTPGEQVRITIPSTVR